MNILKYLKTIKIKCLHLVMDDHHLLDIEILKNKIK